MLQCSVRPPRPDPRHAAQAGTYICCSDGDQPCAGDGVESDYCCPPDYSCNAAPGNLPGSYYGTACCAPGHTACSAGYPPVLCCPDGTLCGVNYTAGTSGQAYCGAPASILANKLRSCCRCVMPYESPAERTDRPRHVAFQGDLSGLLTTHAAPTAA